MIEEYLKRNKKRFLISIIIVLTVFLFILPYEYFILNLFQPFAPHAIAGYVFTGLIFAFLRWRLLSFITFTCAVLLYAYINPALDFSKEGNFDKAELKIAQFNVFKYNKNYNKLIDKARSTNADFLSFQEIDSKWAKKLKDHLKHKYTYFKVLPVNYNCYGLAVFSKYPLKNIEIRYFSDLPNITGDIIFKDKNIHFVSAHTKSPVTLAKFRRRNRHIKEIQLYCKNLNRKNVMVIGDLNTVPWDNLLLTFKNETGLAISRKSFTSTFPAFMGQFGLPIDYIFHSSSIECLKFKSIPNTSSDHFGILGYYNIDNANMTAKK